MTTAPDLPSAQELARAEDVIDRFARSAGAEFRLAPSDDSFDRVVSMGEWRKRRQIAVGVVSGVVLLVGMVVMVGRSDVESPTVASTPTTVVTSSTIAVTPSTAATPVVPTAALVPATNDPRTLPAIDDLASVGAVDVADVDRPNQVITDGTTVWVMHDGGPISRFDASSGELLGTIAVTNDEHAERPLLAFGSLWVTTDRDNTLWRIDAETGEVVDSLIVPGDIVGGRQFTNPINVSASADALWVLTHDPDRSFLIEVDPSTMSTGRSIEVRGTAFYATYAFDSLWTLTSGSLYRIDPTTGAELGRVTVDSALKLRSGLGSMWTVADRRGQTLTRVDSSSLSVTAALSFPGQLASAAERWHGDIAFGGGFVWMNSPDALLLKIDPSANRIIGRFGPGSLGGSVAATATDVWFTDYAGNKLYRLPIG